MTRTDDVTAALRKAGAIVLRLFEHEDEKSLSELDSAIENAKQLDEYAQTAQVLEKSAWNTLPGSREWQAFFSAQRKYLCCMRRHRKNSRRFGWSPLARKLLWERYCTNLKQYGADPESDPMEELLQEYGVPMQKAPSGIARQWDEQDRRMEELLNGKW